MANKAMKKYFDIEYNKLLRKLNSDYLNSLKPKEEELYNHGLLHSGVAVKAYTKMAQDMIYKSINDIEELLIDTQKNLTENLTRKL